MTGHAAPAAPGPGAVGQDVLDRVTAIIGPAAASSPDLALWLFFLDAHGAQANFLVLVDAVTGFPCASTAANTCYNATAYDSGGCRRPVLIWHVHSGTVSRQPRW